MVCAPASDLRKAESFSIQVAVLHSVGPSDLGRKPAGLFRARSRGATAPVQGPCMESDSVMTKIYVGNLPFTANENEVRELFSQHGTVESVSLITDRET